MPKRIQRKRTKGWRMPEGVVYVGRPTKWGNPFFFVDISLSLKLYRNAILGIWDPTPIKHLIEDLRQRVYGAHLMFRGRLVTEGDHFLELRDHDLACWCRLCPKHADGRPLGVKCDDCAPCHADVVLELANR